MQINGVVYDCECVPNCFTLCAVDLNSDTWWYFEISDFRNDTVALWQFLEFIQVHDWYMIGFNNVGYDYELLHVFFTEPVGCTPAKLYNRSQQIIKSFDRFGDTVRPDDRYFKQIDLFKIHHFDNKAKSTSLKALEVNLRADNVMESTLPFDRPLTQDEIIGELMPYNANDVKEPKRFALISMPMIEFRIKLAATLQGDVLNFNDTKIGKQTIEQRLADVCYSYDGGRKIKRQTPRDRIAVSDILFPYISFREPEFQRIHGYFHRAVITDTKAAFGELSCTIRGFTFHFGTGGIHGSLERTRLEADDQWAIDDIDVASLYPSIAIVNQLAPAHLGQRFVQEYAAIKTERFKHAKGTPENTALKLALNGVYGDSNNEFSVFYDPQFTMTITINGQLLLCMLAEALMTVPTLSIIQINTDGVTYRIHRSFQWMATAVQKQWEAHTLLDLEAVSYSRMWIRDVNNYVAETAGSGKIKAKGAYWTPDKFPDDIQNASPTAWYKNFNADVSAKAAVNQMKTGQPIDQFIHAWQVPFDFMLREKTQRGHVLYIGQEAQQRVTRYYVARDGQPMRKVMPPKYPSRVGMFKAAQGVSDAQWQEHHDRWGNIWSPTVHTKNRSTYEAERATSLASGFVVRPCNRVTDFDWSNVNYDYYIAEARKLLI